MKNLDQTMDDNEVYSSSNIKNKTINDLLCINTLIK